MTTKKGKIRKTTSPTKLYSYDEFRKTFYPDSDFVELAASQDPRAFGRRLGEEAVRRIKQQVQARTQAK